MLWTFGCSERIPGADTDYGLFNQNLIDFEKDGRIVIKKLQETFKVKKHKLDTFYQYNNTRFNYSGYPKRFLKGQ